MYLSDLRSLYELPGPWVSVYLDASRDSERGREDLGLRWRAAQHSLDEAGADRKVVSALEDAMIAEGTDGPHGLAGFAAVDPATGRVVTHVDSLPRPPAVTSAMMGTLPHVMPMLEQRGEQVSWLRIVIDRTGADIEQAAAGRTQRCETVEGPESYPLTKTGAGGWSTRRYQSGVELSWERNVSAVASETLRLAEDAKAEALIVAGDVRARQLLMDQLPRQWRDRVVQTETGSRAAGADPHVLDEATRKAVSDIAAGRVEEALDRYRVQLAGDTAATGLAAAVGALQRNGAEAVLVDPPRLEEARLWVGSEPEYVACTDKELRRLGVDGPQPVRADDGLVRAAACTGAELFIVDGRSADLRDGVAVLLRNNPTASAPAV